LRVSSAAMSPLAAADDPGHVIEHMAHTELATQ
jgi:hypothetical protein